MRFVVVVPEEQKWYTTLSNFLFHFLTFAHSINVIFSLFMTKEGLKRKELWVALSFIFLLSSFSAKTVGYYRRGILIRKDMIEFLGGSPFLEFTIFFLGLKKILIWFKDMVSPTYSSINLAGWPLLCISRSSHTSRVHRNFVIMGHCERYMQARGQGTADVHAAFCTHLFWFVVPLGFTYKTQSQKWKY